MTSIADGLLDWLTLRPVTGPIFDKELRVTSRRRRYYVLRFVYLILLLIFLAMIWMEEVRYNSTSLMTISRMSVAGQMITSVIVWFQFIGLQVVAVIMLSTAISEEVVHRTLGVLMTTPITSFQIVFGKLLSRLWQLLLLLGISLPVLAVIRVFGGIPWGFLAAGLSITLTTVLFVGSLTMLFSIYFRRSYGVILITVITVGVLFGLVPLIAGLSLMHTVNGDKFVEFFGMINPYFCQMINTIASLEPRGMGKIVYGTGYWLIHCGIMLGVTFLLLLFSVWRVRRVAMRQITGEQPVLRSPSDTAGGTTSRETKMRTVHGRPVFWKECRQSLFGRHRVAGWIVVLLGLGLLGVTYVLLEDSNDLKDSDCQAMFGIVFLSLGLLVTAVLPSTCITSEKESGAMPLLLTTTLSDWEITWGKYLGAVRRCLPVWGLLMGHLILFVFVGYLEFWVLPLIGLLVTWIVILLSASGLYFSVRFKHTTTAVIMNIGTWAAVWGLIPLILVFIIIAGNTSDNMMEAFADWIPFVQCAVLIDGSRSVTQYHWIGLRGMNLMETLIWMMIFTGVYSMIGSVFFLRARAQLRRTAMR